MDRREFLLALTCLTASSCKRTRSKREVLSALVREVVTPDVRAVVLASRALRESVAAFAATPSPSGLRAAREACRTALPAWKRAHCFRNGPMVETNALLRATFWPARPPAIEGALAGTAPLDDDSIEALGADAKGLYALEYLLFPLELDEQQTLRQLGGEGSERRRSLLCALARNVETHANAASGVLGDGTAYAQRFAAGGQDSISRLVNQMISSVETLAVSRLDLVLGLAQSRLLKPAEVEGWPSGTSHLLALAELTGVRQLYGGGERTGLTDLVRAVAPAIDQRLERSVSTAVGALEKLDAPLERVVLERRPLLASALASLKALELALKVDVASALGVTLTFQTGDGD